MVKRVFWVALGASVGVLVVTKASATLRRFTPSGMVAGAAGMSGALGEAVRGFLDDVHHAAAEREMELYHALGVDTPDAALDGPRDRANATDN